MIQRRIIARLVGGPPAVHRRNVHARGDAEHVLVLLPPGGEPIPYTEVPKDGPPTPPREGEGALPVPYALYRRSTHARYRDGAWRAKYTYVETVPPPAPA